MRDWGGGGRLNITAQNPAIGAASGNAIKRNIPISGNPARQRAGKDSRLIAAFGFGELALRLFTGAAEVVTGAGSTRDFCFGLRLTATGAVDDDF